MNTFYSLAMIAILPVITSIILHVAFGNERVKLSNLAKQIIAGVIFGFLAILGTEFGVPIEGAVINARDAAPLCAGLIFGPISGIMAGLIGGIERWFAVYWGAGSYTRLACSISTCLAGFLSAGLRKYLYDDQITTANQALIISIAMEVTHMLMIFITNIYDVKKAFTFVLICTYPMVLVNALAVTLAVFIVNRIDHFAYRESKQIKSINSRFQNTLIIVVIIAYGFMSLLGSFLQRQVEVENTRQSLYLNVSDTAKDVEDRCDEALLHINRLVAEIIDNADNYDLKKMKSDYNVAEIDVINKSGIIIASSEDDNVGFNMALDKEQSGQFLVLLEKNGPTEVVQAFMPTSKDATYYLKYSGVRISDGFVQVAYNGEQMNEEISSLLSNIAVNQRVGENGFVLIIDEYGRIISLTSDSVISNKDLSSLNIVPDPDGDEEYKVYECTISGVPYYYMFDRSESYSIIGVLPKSEADFSRQISEYLNEFTMAIMFGILFIVVSMITKNQIVQKVDKINDSLDSITNGNLDTVVDVKSSIEFSSLSDGINVTVDSLKSYIAEANARIDSELKYAKEIQASTLPAYFPAFPERHEFDIYALMDPAKEVGGDFYDFYILNNDTLAFVVADVSGKGIPASLFMMRAKTTLKTYAENNIGVADIFTNANYQLCEGNNADMFVTAWMGFLNLKTGELKFANAGHNRPLLRRKDGTFEYLSGKVGFVLGGMEGIVYKEQSVTLEPGDEIFLYTDGVVEATNVNMELYGDDRLQQCINGLIGEDCMTICKSIRKDVDIFYDGAPQFDDITELSVQFKSYSK